MSDASTPSHQQPPPPSPSPQSPSPQSPSPQSNPSQPPPGYPIGSGGYGTPPPGAPRSDQGNSETRPKSRWFWIGGGIMVLGVAAAIAFGVISFFGINSSVDDFARVSSGTDTVSIDSTGKYVIYAEDGSFSATVDVTSPDGEPVFTSSYLGSLEYDFDGRSGQAVATFDADDTGRYTVTTDTDVAIGPSLAGDLIRMILIPFVIVGLGFLVGLIVIIVTAVRRSGSKKRMAYST